MGRCTRQATEGGLWCPEHHPVRPIHRNARRQSWRSAEQVLNLGNDLDRELPYLRHADPVTDFEPRCCAFCAEVFVPTSDRQIYCRQACSDHARYSRRAFKNP
jgi:hypothetical protein